jgi:hypothetical protein
MKARLWTIMVALAAVTTIAAATPEADRLPGARQQGRTAEKAAPARELTEDEKAFLERARQLRKDQQIARLELALAEAKEAPERDIAAKAEQLYRLQGEQRAFMAKHRELARGLRQHMAQNRWQHRRGMGGGRHQGWGGPGMGRDRGARGMHQAWGGTGMGRARGGQDMGPASAEPGAGRGGRGMRHGPGRRVLQEEDALKREAAPAPQEVQPSIFSSDVQPL